MNFIVELTWITGEGGTKGAETVITERLFYHQEVKLTYFGD